MGTTVTNNTRNDNSAAMAALGIVTVFGMFLALILFSLMACLILGTAYSTAYFGYKVYQLRVHKVISLAQVAAGQIPHPTLSARERTYPTMKELMVGRDHA